MIPENAEFTIISPISANSKSTIVRMHSPKRIKITDVNPHLICVLCGGYYIDATTIIECLHSFCKSCIVRYLQQNKYCPICDVQVHKTAPLLNIRSDRTLQNIVYKLVPSLFKNEMDRRVAFYEKCPGAIPSVPEQRGEVTDNTPIFFPDELLIICLEYQTDKNIPQPRDDFDWPKRYLHCPAAITVSHLAKLIRGKFGLSHIHRVNLYFKDDLLQDDITIMDIAYTYQCRRKIPIHLMYRILEFKKKIIKLMPPVPPNKVETLTNPENGCKSNKENCKTNKRTQEFPEEIPCKSDKFQAENGKECLSQAEVGKNSAQTNSQKVHGNGNKVVEVEQVTLCTTSQEKAEVNNTKEGNKNSVSKDGTISSNDVTRNGSAEDLKESKAKEDPLSVNESGDGEWKEVQLQISENGVMSVRNMKSIECSPIPAVEAPNCPISHPTTTSQVNSIVTSTKTSLTTVAQTRNAEPIVSVSKVSKEQVKKEINHSIVPGENKLSISRVASPGSTGPVAKGDVLNRIVSKLSPNETVIGNTGVTIRPVTKVYPGMKSVQERKSRGSSNHSHTRYKAVSQSSPWNPTIDRTTMLSLKQNCDLNKPPRFFKMRNAPRYLGNPAEGVKPLYGGGIQEDTQSKRSSPKSPVKQPPPYTPRGQDKPPPPYTPRPAHTGGGGVPTTYLPPNPYHLLYSGFPFSGANPELLRSMCASAAYHPSLPPSISMLYNNPNLPQTPPPPSPRSQPSSPHDFKGPSSALPSIQRIPSSLSPKLPALPLLSLEEKKRDISSPTSPGPVKSHKPIEDIPPPPLASLIIPLPPPPLPLSDKLCTSLTNNNNTKESPLPTKTNQHPLK